MRRQLIKLVFLAIFLSLASYVSATTVTAQVKDPMGALYRTCSGSANFIGQSSNPGPYRLGGISTFQTVVPISCDGSANFTVSISDNNLITPAPSQWSFSICSAVGAFPGPPICFTTLITITGTTQNITAELQAAAAPLPVPTGTTVTLETNGALNGSQSLLNLIQGANITIVDNGLGGITITGTGGGGGSPPGGSNRQVQYNNSGSFGGTGTTWLPGDLSFNNSTGMVTLSKVNNVVTATADYNWLQTDVNSSIGNLAIAGAGKVLTLTPCPLGFDNAVNANFPYTISIAGTGTPELVTVTAASGAAGSASCTATVTTLNAHAAGFTVGSASSGIQEAIYDACRQPTYNLSQGGNCEVDLLPAQSSLTPNYTILGRVWLQGNSTFKATLRGNHALVRNSTRDVGIYMGNLSNGSSGAEIYDVSFTNSTVTTGVQIADVTAAAGTYTIHTASAHDFSMTGTAGQPDFVYVHFQTTGGSLRGVYQVTSVADNTHFTIQTGSATFSNAAGFGSAVLENAYIENNSDGAVISNIRNVSVSSSPGPSFGIIVDNDQNGHIYHPVEIGTGTRCNANFCGSFIYTKDTANTTISNPYISPQCNGNGILATGGNGVQVRGGVIQGFQQFGMRAIQSLVSSTFDGVYEESTGACNNPQAPANAQKNQAGLIVSNGLEFTVLGEFPLSGWFPTFASGGGSGSQINYFVIWHSSTSGVSDPFPVGMAQPANGGVSISVSFPYVQLDSGMGTITCDLLATTGTTMTPLTGTQTIAVLTGQACTPNNAGWVTLTDTQAARSSYSINAATWAPPLGYWPGNVVLGSPVQGIFDVSSIGTVASNNFGQVSVFARICQNIRGNPNVVALIMPVLYSCYGAPDTPNTTGSFAATFQNADTGQNSAAGVKGRINLLSPGNHFGSNFTHLITLMDSNQHKTKASIGMRPTADAGDAYIGNDTAFPTYGVSYGSPVSHHFYIGNTGDGTSWVEELAGSLATLRVPLRFNGATSGSFQIGAAAVAGTPNRINFPTTTGANGGLLQSDGGNPQQTSWVTPVPSTLVDGATISWDLGSNVLGNATVTLGGNRTINVSNLITGGSYVLRVVQDGTGGRTLTLGTGCTWKVANGGGGTITLSAGANAIDILTVYYDGTNCYAAVGLNYN